MTPVLQCIVDIVLASIEIYDKHIAGSLLISLFCLDYYPNFHHFSNHDDDSDGLSAGVITSISVGSVVSCIAFITLLMIAFVCVRRNYIKRRYRMHSVTNQTLLANESSEMVPLDFLSPPAYISAPNTTVSYDELVNVDTDVVATSIHCYDTQSDSLPRYTPLNQPPDNASNDVLAITPNTQEDTM